ncbi:MAG: HD domain-containing protein [Acidobacteriota bacterium]|nr:HD domain-containing protein [Acidobacteriota bacterium]
MDKDPAAILRKLRRATAGDALLSGLAEEARGRGWSVHVVGGWIRDRCLARPFRDLDLTLGSGAAEALEWLAARSSHRTVTFERRVTNHRLTIEGRAVDVVERDRRDLVTELERRDFTVNAVAYDLGQGELSDPCGGLDDLAAGLLRPPRDDSFRRDPLRMLRGVRLATEIPVLALTERARTLIREKPRALRAAAPERIREELDRILATSRASLGIEDCDRLGLLTSWIPEIEGARGVTQNRYHHLDVWSHTLDALAGANHPARLGRGLFQPGWPRRSEGDGEAVRPDPRLALLVLRWSLLIHDLGKPETRRVGPTGEPTFYGHEGVGETLAEEIGRRLVMPGERIRAIRLVVKNHLRLVVPKGGLLSDRALARIVRALGPWVEVLALHALADQGASRGGGWRRVRSRLRATIERLLDVERRVLARRRVGRLLTGRDVMRVLDIEPGPVVGRILSDAMRLQEDGVLTAREQALEWLARQAG